MHPLIEAHRQEIEALCQRYNVNRLEVFGSLLRDDFNAATSDADLIVDFQRQPQGEELQQYFGFKEELEHVLGRHVDLIELRAMGNTRLKRIIERTKVPVYAAPA